MKALGLQPGATYSVQDGVLCADNKKGGGKREGCGTGG